MEKLDMPHGPWTPVLKAEWGEYQVSLYANPEKILAFIIFEKKGEEITGALVMLKKVFLCRGNTSNLLSAQKREITIIEKLSKEFSYKYIVISSSPAYVHFLEKELSKSVRKQYEELEGISRITSSFLADHNIEVKDFKKGSGEEVSSLLGDPLFLFSLSQGVSAVPKSARIYLGLGQGKEPLELKQESLKRLLVFGGTREKRIRMLHILCEGCLLSDSTCIVFDSSSFKGFSTPNPDSSELQHFNMQPMSFPVKTIEPGKDFFVDLGRITPDLFLNAFGLNTDAAIPIKAVYSKEIISVGDLADRLKGLKETREMPQYLINKSIRILQVIQKVHASLFAKNAGEWPLQGGRIMRVDLSKQPESIQHLLIQSSLSFMKSEPMPIVVFEQDASSLPMGLIESVVQANAGLIVHSEKGINLSAFGGEKAKIELIGNEAVLTEEGERPKRFLVRPSHSQCTGKS